MPSLAAAMAEYRAQLDKGAIQVAYRGLLEYMSGLRTHLADGHPDMATTGLYPGYMDMTYFALVPPALKELKLKVAIVFLHRELRFEAWLSGQNKQVHAHYWRLLQDSGWDKYRLVPPGPFADSILEHVLVADPDFAAPDALTKQIERSALAFIADVEGFLGAV